MSQKNKYIISLVFIFVLVGLSVFGLINRGIGLGLDIRGGLNVVLTAKETPKTPVNQATMDQALFIMRNRIDKLGVSEPSIEQHGNKNIILQLPGIKDANNAIDIIGQTALLEFAIVQEKYVNMDIGQMNTALAKKEEVLGKALMTGDNISGASAGFNTENPAASDHQVTLKFSSTGTQEFGSITTNNTKKRLAIVLDGKIITAPTIQTAINDGNAVITGIETMDEAKEIALVLQTGQLPFKLDISQQQAVGPTLGRDSLDAALIAAIAGFILVALFMVGFYRVFGAIAVVSLASYSALLLGLLILLDYALSAVGTSGISLSLPSFAGLILMIGIAADSSIIIYERIKEEIRSGKSMRTAIDNGFNHGFHTFLDADLVTFITAAVLFYFGVGPIKGFALVLMAGIFMDIVISLLFKRPVLKLIAMNNWINKPSLIGIRGVDDA